MAAVQRRQREGPSVISLALLAAAGAASAPRQAEEGLAPFDRSVMEVVLAALDRSDVAWLSAHAPGELRALPAKLQQLAGVAPARARGAPARVSAAAAPPRALGAQQLARVAECARQIVRHARSRAYSFNLTFQPVDAHAPAEWRALLGTNFSMAERVARARARPGDGAAGAWLGEHVPSHAPPAALGARAGERARASAGMSWVEAGVVPRAVGSQGFCASCWAFVAADAVAASAELAARAADARAAPPPVAAVGAAAAANVVPLAARAPAEARSAQQFVSCDRPAEYGCTGGTPAQALSYARTHAIASARDFPYLAWAGAQPPAACALPAGGAWARARNPLLGFRSVRRGDESAMLDALALGPLTAGVDASSFRLTHYASGVLDFDGCGRELNHAVLVVGHGYDGASGKPYWLLKSSWGSGWGERGYARLVRGRNMCGIAELVAYAVWDESMRGSAARRLFARAAEHAPALALAALAAALAAALVAARAPRPAPGARHGGGGGGAPSADARWGGGGGRADSKARGAAR
ncbi:hypothetical protein KFE25_013138 [Diacronema lutheri]|uniref:Peptidase C1A papain C-terminal domain-containing protein n=1 Tax=Diacronema lutheri TaxID=2081491 RepID=A0A8J5X6K3_DIALT|nr:hypothetical protein KFE25_013138 [Diacronema lutheri]